MIKLISERVFIMKKTLLIIICCFILLALCSCATANTDFKEGSLLFDMGATSFESIDSCIINDDGPIPEIILDKAEYDVFAKYRYKNDYPSDKLHELMVFPTNKLINVTVNDNTFALYLMPNGDIGVKISDDEPFKVYEADGKYKITQEKYNELISDN